MKIISRCCLERNKEGYVIDGHKYCPSVVQSLAHSTKDKIQVTIYKRRVRNSYRVDTTMPDYSYVGLHIAGGYDAVVSRKLSQKLGIANVAWFYMNLKGI